MNRNYFKTFIKKDGLTILVLLLNFKLLSIFYYTLAFISRFRRQGNEVEINMILQTA